MEPGRFFNTVNKIANRKVSNIPPLRDAESDEVIAQTDSEIADTLHQFYCKKLNNRIYPTKLVSYKKNLIQITLM